MKPRRLLWQLYPSYLFITLISLAAIGLYSSTSLQKFYYAQVTEELKASAQIIEEQILASYKTGDRAQAGARRVRGVDPSGHRSGAVGVDRWPDLPGTNFPYSSGRRAASGAVLFGGLANGG